MPRFRSQLRRRGFTFVELMVGIVVTSIVLCALAVFTFGVGQNWQDSDAAQSAFLAGGAGIDRLRSLVRAAQMIDPNPTTGSLDNSTAPAAAMLWTDQSGDGLIECCELTLLQYDQTAQALMKYTLPASASNAQTQVAGLISAASFKALPNVVATPVVHDVAACQIFSNNTAVTTPRPSMEFVLKMSTGNDSSSALIYSTVTARSPESAGN